ncbi:F-box protein [Actinidia chinensis var. chinensis]|uniref:F-box protein n=1 Tax=Actinidia chinensis var. chinensis TaxID=1590841 RepID=A0A2R6RGM4_ACTCC|nr:F-box protein [Actinidia chinensis var. chinensis]
MLSKFSVIRFNPSLSFPIIPYHHENFLEIKCCATNSPPPPSSSSSDRKFRFRLKGVNTWKLNDIDSAAVQETLNQWLSKTQGFLNEVTSPLVKNVHDRKPNPGNMFDTQDTKDIFLAEQTIDSRTPNGSLSLAAVVSIEQFSRMNGLTGLKMQKIFKALVPESVYSDSRNLVEYCFFRFLSRDSSEIHPCLKEPAFRRLIFITMLAWEKPYCIGKDPQVVASERASFERSLVREEAFVRIAPAISGVADRSTAHNLFKALAGDERGISFNLWSTYIDELLKVHEGRKLYKFQDGMQQTNERILCLSLSRKRPVLKWEKNMAWPGKLTLTDKALYFEGVSLVGQKVSVRLDLTSHGSRVEKTRVGPLGFDLFDSAISVFSGAESKTWVLEFVDLGGEMRRDAWYAFISEVIALYKFIHEFGPKDDDRSVPHVYGAHKGKARATTYATNGIARLQALQFMRKVLENPIKLVPFSFLQNAPYGDVVCQTLAVNCWGGQLVTKFTEGGYVPRQGVRTSNEVSESNSHVFDVDGSVYLRKWMISPSWASSASAAFWKNSSVRQGVVLSKNLVVADMTLVEKAAIICKEKYREVEKTQATIYAAMLEGIPSNIDLFKELLLPLTVTAKSLEKLRRWEEPYLTAGFLAFAYAIIFRNLLPFIFPTTLTMLAAGMLLLKGLREQGRLGRYFAKVTIRDQQSSNTIQKIIAVKEAMREVEKNLQNLNVSLLKIRTILLAGQPQITTEVALVLLISSAILIIVPFKYILAFFLFDLFTRELEFRREMVTKFMSLLKERWDAVPAAPVVVLPYESDETRPPRSQTREINEIAKPESSQSSGKSR